jgi:hypothetical protein
VSDYLAEIKRHLVRQDQKLSRIEQFIEHLVTKDAPGSARLVIETVLDGPVETVEALYALDRKLKADSAFSDKLVSYISWGILVIDFPILVVQTTFFQSLGGDDCREHVMRMLKEVAHPRVLATFAFIGQRKRPDLKKNNKFKSLY